MHGQKRNKYYLSTHHLWPTIKFLCKKNIWHMHIYIYILMPMNLAWGEIFFLPIKIFSLVEVVFIHETNDARKSIFSYMMIIVGKRPFSTFFLRYAHVALRQQMPKLLYCFSDTTPTFRDNVSMKDNSQLNNYNVVLIPRQIGFSGDYILDVSYLDLPMTIHRRSHLRICHKVVFM